MSTEPLLNPVVLDVIFANLDVPDLKSARLVCREWRDVGASCLGKRTYLDPNKLFPFTDGKYASESELVDPKLMRRLTLWDCFHPSVPADKRTHDRADVLFRTPHVADLTHEIHFLVSMNTFTSKFVIAMRNFEARLLKHVSLVVYTNTKSIEHKGPFPTCDNFFPPRPSLTSMKFEYEMTPVKIRRHKYGLHQFRPLFRAWIVSAVNLAVLEVADCFCPNLEDCSNLKVLKFHFLRCDDRFSGNLELGAVTEMLSQVKDSLVELELRYSCRDRLHRYQTEKLDLPVMSKLASLILHAADIYQIQDCLDEAHLPKLVHLSLDKSFSASTTQIHENLRKRHEGIQSLAVIMDWRWKKEAIAGKMVNLFPSVKKLDFRMVLLGDVFSPNGLNELLEPFRLWGLEQSNVRVRVVNNSSLLVAVLRNVSNWKGKKTAEFNQIRVTQKNFVPCIEDVILYSGGFEKVKMSGFAEPKIVKTIRTIFKDRSVPINFTGGVHTK